MKIIKINNYDELEKLKEENEFIVDMSDTPINFKSRVIDFLGGVTHINGGLKKLSANNYKVTINKI